MRSVDLAQLPSGMAHKLPFLFSTGFEREIGSYSSEVLGVVYAVFAENGFIGMPVDPEGYLLCTLISVRKVGLFYAVDKAGNGLHLLALRRVRFNASRQVEVDGDLEDVISEARQLGMPTADKFQELRRLMHSLGA
jgi:hypothetical protein